MKEISCSFGGVDAVARRLGSCGGEYSTLDISRGMFAGGSERHAAGDSGRRGELGAAIWNWL